MIVNNGKTLLGQQGLGKQAQSKSNDADHFQDILVGAKKKSSQSNKAAKKTYGLKRKKDQEAYDENQNVAKRQDRPVKNKDSEKPARVNAQKADRQGRADQQHQKQEASAKNINDKKFTEVSEKSQQPGDSLNLSGIENKTLEKNQKVLESMETKFQQMMSEIKNKQVAKGAEQKFGQAMQSKLGAGINADGKIKIGAEMKAAEGTQTLGGSDLGMSMKGIQASGKEGAGDSGMNNSTSNLESLFNQYMEQDNQVGEVEGATFGEELTQVENGKSEKIENMQSIIKQARAFVDDGGGSMEIHLQPEGLGKVQLKVAVHDGQVNVEMMADNMAAKKALEEGLVDIKSALENQKLLVETLKVEMTPDYQKDFSDLANHAQEQANKDFAEQFLGQFRQEREERTNGMFDSLRSFQPGSRDPDLTLSRNPYADRGKGRSVNLVA